MKQQLKAIFLADLMVLKEGVFLLFDKVADVGLFVKHFLFSAAGTIVNTDKVLLMQPPKIKYFKLITSIADRFDIQLMLQIDTIVNLIEVEVFMFVYKLQFIDWFGTIKGGVLMLAHFDSAFYIIENIYYYSI